MSDGALSQDEIDALLAGVDSSGMAGLAPSTPAVAVAPGGSDADRQALQNYLASTVDAQSSNLSMMMGGTVSIRSPQVNFTSRDNFLSQLPDTITAVKADFSSGFPGEHIFIFPEAAAKAVASMMNKEDNIELDEMAMSVIGEVVSQMVGTQITSLSDKTGNKSIASVSPEAANVPKAVAALPGGDFASAMYQLDMGGGKNFQMWEIFGSSVAMDIARSLNGGGGSQAKGMPAMDSGAMQMPGMQMPGMGVPSMGMPGMGMPAMGMGGMQMPGMGMPAMGMGGMQMPGMGMPGMGMGMPTNVQSVQFPNLLAARGGSQEAGNISLIMDVFMEMTVELGRTRKLIKEILGMGEGTIIELDKLAGEPVDILVNHKLIAKGEVVVIDENFGVRVTEIVSPMERMSDMG
jgi:flagellar motor switch protein FliN/FliY